MRGYRETRVGLITALPQEACLILLWPGWRRMGATEVRAYELALKGMDLMLCISGMGEENSRRAAKFLLEGFGPQEVFCFGFGGALNRELRVGDLIGARKLYLWDESLGLSPGPDPEFRYGASLQGAHVITARDFVAKKRVLRTLNEEPGPFVLDLETYFVCEEASKRGIRFSCIRAISDEWDSDPGPKVARWVDSRFRLRVSRIAASLLSSPKDLIVILDLYRWSKVAAKSLERGLRDVVFGELTSD